MAMWHSASAATVEPQTRPAHRGKPWVLLIIFAAFAVRLWNAWGTFLNPDEALHFLIANKTSWAAAYKASLSTAHPPGLIFVLYFWRGLGTSELILRLPSILSGTAFCWFLYRWLEDMFNRNVAWIGLLLASFLPPVVALSTEVRQYALLLMFMAAAMYLFEEALASRSAARMLASGACCCLALTFHYSALLFAAAFGVYGLIKVARVGRASIQASWIANQAGVVALLGFFYIHHIAKLAGNAMAQQTVQGWLANSYFHPGKQNFLIFVFARSFGVFQFVFGQLAVGDVAGLAFLVGIILLWQWRATATILFLTLPFAIACVLAVAGKYPYGGTRHSAFLIPFAITGVAVATDYLAKEKLRIGAAAALVILVLSAAFGAPHRPYITRGDQSADHMHDAIAFLRREVKPQQAIVVDYQTSLLLGHYLCNQQPMMFNTSVAGFEEFRCNGLRVISTGPQLQIFTSPSFLDPKLWLQLAGKFGITPGQTVWVVQAGWDIELAQQLQERAIDPKSFGNNINVLEFTAPATLGALAQL
jgi:4-amino-4-deoxy-L-arabinose transferase-like glycosyltransferase